MSFSLSCLCILVVFVHLTESRVLILREFNNEPLILDHKESQEEIPIIKIPIITVNTPKKIRSTKKTILQFGRQIYHLDNYEDTQDLRSKLKPKSISYDYFDIGELKRSSLAAKKGISHYLNEIFVLSETPQRVCYGRQCEDDSRKYNKKHKNDDDTEWKHKKMQIPLGHMKRFQIVDNIHNSVRNPKFGSEEYQGKKKGNKGHKKKKDSSASDESKDAGSKEASTEISDEKEDVKNSEEMQIENEKGSTEVSLEKSENQDKDSKSEEEIPKKKPKKKKIDNTKRKTIPKEDTYFMQGNKIFHSSGKSKKRHRDDSRRSRLEHFMPKRYHWDPSEIHDLGYYWFNGPKGMYSEPRVLSK